MGTASKVDPTLPDKHHHDPEATSLPDLMAINQAAASIRLNWTVPFIEYLTQENLPNDLTEAQHLATCYKSYMFIGNILYKRNTLGILQRCISQEG